MDRRPNIETLNELDLGPFKKRLLKGTTMNYASKGIEYEIDLESSKTTNDTDFEACFDLIEFTSKADYDQSSTRWRPKSKKAEMKHVDMRYLLVRQSSTTKLLGFASFMLTYEGGKEVIYLFEIHLSEELRGCGLGKHLIKIVSQIGYNAGVDKIVLTVFLSNTSVFDWYNRLGFAVDEFWPAARTLRSGVVKQADYRILSRAIS